MFICSPSPLLIDGCPWMLVDHLLARCFLFARTSASVPSFFFSPITLYRAFYNSIAIESTSSAPIPPTALTPLPFTASRMHPARINTSFRQSRRLSTDSNNGGGGESASRSGSRGRRSSLTRIPMAASRVSDGCTETQTWAP